MMYTLTDGRLDSVQIVHAFDVGEFEEEFWLENIETTLIINGVEFDIDLSQHQKGDNGMTAMQDIELFIRYNVDDWEFCGTDETEPIRD